MTTTYNEQDKYIGNKSYSKLYSMLTKLFRCVPFKLSLVSMDEVNRKTQRIPWRGVLALVGGFLIQLTLGSFYSFGNMMTYMTSYMRANGHPEMGYGDFIAVQSVWGMTQGLVMPVSGFLVQYTGPRAAMLGGCTIFSIGTATTYFSLNMNLWMVIFTYGFTSALGQAIALIPTMTIGMRWFPNRKGMAMGVVVGGFGGGAFIFNQIQTAILNPNNIAPVDFDGKKYFTDPDLLGRVPSLMLILGGIYITIQLIACFLVTEPTISPELIPSGETDTRNDILMDEVDGENYVTPQKALFRKEFYLLWMTRFCVVLISQSVAGFYKAFGQTFIEDDHFLSFVGAVSSIFNCSGRLFYGILMDKSSYRLAMSIETFALTILIATLPFTYLGGKTMFAIWIWLIYFTFPGTYSMQPAVTTQTFGHQYGGTIYGFLFTSDIVNNILISLLSKPLLQAGGWQAVFLCLAVFGVFSLAITCLFPANPSPGSVASPELALSSILDGVVDNETNHQEAATENTRLCK